MDPKEEIPPVDPGTVLAFDNAVEKLRVTLADQRALDTKAATMIALLGGAVAAYAVVATTTLERVVGGLLLFAAVVTALLAYRITAFGDAPRPDAFAEYRGYPPETMKQQFLAPALTAWLDNRGRLVRKGRLINATFYLVGALAVLVIVVRLFNLDTRLPH